MFGRGSLKQLLSARTAKSFLIGLSVISFMHCRPSRAEPQIIFANGFDVPAFPDLFQKDLSGWTNIQKTFPQNKAEIVSEPRRDGAGALRLHAVPSKSDVSKCDIEKELPSINRGQTVHISAWFLIPPGPELNNLFLLDIECNQCWPERSLISDKGPGVRIRLTGPSGKPFVERRKIGLSDMPNELGTSAPLPRGRWFKFEWRLVLSPDESGLTEIFVDEEPVFRGRGPNLPDPQIFRRYGVELRQVLYNRLQVGITANSSSNPIELFVDDVSVAVN
ncbi:heparin lyase I family protein [Microvirga pakistanensis]|uniref:heparin lyase I family protein n=1 Tax=Microvirga pakistanensis TaxID=1682650 RepID=UPI00106D17F9|nr:heparin lyase I family protein [Microvirga pakistanensis]